MCGFWGSHSCSLVYQQSLPQHEKETVSSCVFISGRKWWILGTLWGREKIGEVPNDPNCPEWGECRKIQVATVHSRPNAWITRGFRGAGWAAPTGGKTHPKKQKDKIKYIYPFFLRRLQKTSLSNYGKLPSISGFVYGFDLNAASLNSQALENRLWFLRPNPFPSLSGKSEFVIRGLILIVFEWFIFKGKLCNYFREKSRAELIEGETVFWDALGKDPKSRLWACALQVYGFASQRADVSPEIVQEKQKSPLEIQPMVCRNRIAEFSAEYIKHNMSRKTKCPCQKKEYSKIRLEFWF